MNVIILSVKFLYELVYSTFQWSHSTVTYNERFVFTLLHFIAYSFVLILCTSTSGFCIHLYWHVTCLCVEYFKCFVLQLKHLVMFNFLLLVRGYSFDLCWFTWRTFLLQIVRRMRLFRNVPFWMYRPYCIDHLCAHIYVMYVKHALTKCLCQCFNLL